jgi:hypothetical protein
MAQDLGDKYNAAVKAMAEYLAAVEAECKECAPIEIDLVDGQYILDRIDAETDMLDAIANNVRILMKGQ